MHTYTRTYTLTLALNPTVTHSLTTHTHTHTHAHAHARTHARTQTLQVWSYYKSSKVDKTLSGGNDNKADNVKACHLKASPTATLT